MKKDSSKPSVAADPCLTKELAEGVDLSELRQCISRLQAAETPEQRLARRTAEHLQIRSATGDDGEKNSPDVESVRSAIRMVINLEGRNDELQTELDKQKKSNQQLQDLARQLSQQNKAIRVNFESQLALQQAHQDELRTSFDRSMSDIRANIEKGNQERQQQQIAQEELQTRVSAVIEGDRGQKLLHEKQLALKDESIARLQKEVESVREIAVDMHAKMISAQTQLAQSESVIEQYKSQFDSITETVKDNRRAFNDLAKKLSNNGRTNDKLVKTNRRLTAENEALSAALAKANQIRQPAQSQ